MPPRCRHLTGLSLDRGAFSCRRGVFASRASALDGGCFFSSPRRLHLGGLCLLLSPRPARRCPTTPVFCTAVRSPCCAPRFPCPPCRRPFHPTFSPVCPAPPAGSDERPEPTPGPFPEGPSPGMGAQTFRPTCQKLFLPVAGIMARVEVHTLCPWLKWDSQSCSVRSSNFTGYCLVFYAGCRVLGFLCRTWPFAGLRS